MAVGVPHFYDSSRFISATGAAEGGTVFFYETETTDLAPIYTDLELTIPADNPQVIAVGAILPRVFLDPTIKYRRRIVFTDGSVHDEDPIAGTMGTSGGATEVSILSFGAVGDGVTDDYAAFATALASGAKLIYIPPGTYRLSQGIVIPDEVILYGGGLLAYNPAKGTLLKFDLSVMNCVTMGASPGAYVPKCSGIKDITITRATGTPPVGSKGLLVQACFNPLIQNINSVSHSQCIVFDALTYGPGIAAHVINLHTAYAYDAHMVVNTWPELYVTNGRMGVNGGGDQPCNAYVRITGGDPVLAPNGPNTINFANFQFNQSTNQPAHAVSYVNQTPSSISDVAHCCKFVNCHFENMGDLIHSDSSWKEINGLRMVNVSTNKPGADFFNLHPSTHLTHMSISNSRHVGPLTLASTQALDFVNINNCNFDGNVSITSANAGSTLDFNDNTVYGTLTVAGPYAKLNLLGTEAISGMTLTPVLTPAVWSPDVKINGSNTGITYGYRQGVYRVVGNIVYWQMRVILTSKGAAVGGVTIDGLPFNASNNAWVVGGTPISYFANLTGTTPPLFATNNINSKLLNIYQSTATGVTPLTNANLTNTTDIAASGFYYI